MGIQWNKEEKKGPTIRKATRERATKGNQERIESWIRTIGKRTEALRIKE